jgi:hypothetical protein
MQKVRIPYILLLYQKSTGINNTNKIPFPSFLKNLKLENILPILPLIVQQRATLVGKEI